jgi:hypothetical protein
VGAGIDVEALVALAPLVTEMRAVVVEAEAGATEVRVGLCSEEGSEVLAAADEALEPVEPVEPVDSAGPPDAPASVAGAR